MTERGRYDNIVNLPMPYQTEGADFRAEYEREAFPRLRAFGPDLLFVSAGVFPPAGRLTYRRYGHRLIAFAMLALSGFDGHSLDPIGGMLLQVLLRPRTSLYLMIFFFMYSFLCLGE